MLPTIIDLLLVLASGLLGAAAASWLWYSHIRRQAAEANRRDGLPAVDAGDHDPPPAGGGDRVADRWRRKWPSILPCGCMSW